MAIGEARIARDAVFEAMYEELRQARIANTETVQLLRSGTKNDVLLTELVQLDANGMAQRSFPTPYGSVAISNHSAAAAVTVHNGGLSNAAPNRGIGLAQVQKSCAAVVNVAGHVLSLYGPANAMVSIQVFAKAQPPAFGPC